MNTTESRSSFKIKQRRTRTRTRTRRRRRRRRRVLSNFPLYWCNIFFKTRYRKEPPSRVDAILQQILQANFNTKLKDLRKEFNRQLGDLNGRIAAMDARLLALEE